MCGLNGIFAYGDSAPPVDRGELLRTREQMAKRGPDGAGLWLSDDARIGLGHRRLAIIDLSPDGAQPMATRDGRYRIVFNGEIYNYRALRSELQAQGVAFQNQSDTEVLLHLYARHGADMCKRLRGMYAFAIWDTREQSLYLARDAFGIKPLYLHDDGRTLRFASQVKALLAGGAIPREPCIEGEQGYWIWGHVPEPWTLYKDVLALAPGTWQLVRRGGRHAQGTTETVADLLGLDGQHPDRAAPAAQGSLRDTLIDSVEHHLVADVPVGIFLSSGIDSSTLVGLAAERHKDLRTLTLGFKEFQGTDGDETILAEQMARQYGTRHETFWIGRADFENSLDAFLEAMDQPSIDGLNTWLISRAAAQAGLKVVLSGLGGDEFFGGYPSFRQVPRMRRLAAPFTAVPGLARMLRRVSAPVLRRFTSEKFAGVPEYGGTWAGAYLLRRAVRMPWELPGDIRPGVLPQDGHLDAGAPPHLVVSALEARLYMRNQLLRDSDWAGMSQSLELRVPFVDVAVAREVARQCRTGVPYSKRDLAATVQPPLPRAVVERPKTGFVVPVRDWMLSRHTSVQERGLRSWQTLMLARMQGVQHAPLPTPNTVASHALWAPEMAAPGGVQNYMWRLWEMLNTASGRTSGPARGLSLLDSSEELARWPNPTRSRPVGAGGSKFRFVRQAVGGQGRARLVTVGHVNQSAVALLARVLGTIDGYVVVLHGIEAWRRLDWLKRTALRKADSVIATTHFTARTCAQVNGLPFDNFRVIPLCAEPVPMAPEPGFRLDGACPVLVVARLARSEQYKGIEMVIAAVAALRREGLPVKLHIVGDGDDRARLEDLARAAMPDAGAFAFHGRVSDAVLQAAYRSAGIFAMPSAKEGFGIVFLEAMRHGVPCIGGAHGGTPEVFADGSEGVLVQYGDTEGLVARLRELVAAPERARQIGAAGQRRFERDYTFAQFSARWRTALRVDGLASEDGATAPSSVAAAGPTFTRTEAGALAPAPSYPELTTK